MLAFPLSFLLLPLVVGLGVGYVHAAQLVDRRLRVAVRVAILSATCAVPLVTQGPGPAQLILGLLVGYLGIRMVALSQRRADEVRGKSVVLDLITPVGVFRPASQPLRRPVLVILAGCAAIATCVLLLVLGNAWRLWQGSRLGHLLDDQLVALEVAVGMAGVHGLIVGVAQLFGHSVHGLLDQPFRSTSLTEFWGRRWNRMVHINLATGFFRPLARRGLPTWGLFAAFAASGVFHALAVLGAGPLRVVALPCAYVLWSFLGHGLAVLIEQALGWHHRSAHPRAQAMAWARTLFLFLALSPGLLEPLAAAANVHGRSLAPAQAQVNPAALVAPRSVVPAPAMCASLVPSNLPAR
jgi:hypothetical protein